MLPVTESAGAGNSSRRRPNDALAYDDVPVIESAAGRSSCRRPGDAPADDVVSPVSAAAGKSSH